MILSGIIALLRRVFLLLSFSEDEVLLARITLVPPLSSDRILNQLRL